MKTEEHDEIDKQREREYFNYAIKEGIENGRQQTLKDVLELIDNKKSWYSRVKFKYKYKVMEVLQGLRDELKAQIEKQLGVGEK
jgi:hypothetical protein